MDTIKTWIAQEKPAWENFNEFIAVRLEDGFLRSIAEYIRGKMSKGDAEVELAMPWGVYTATNTDSNIGIKYEPTKGFVKLLNGSVGGDVATMDDIDAEFRDLAVEYIAEGAYSSNEATATAKKGLKLSNEEFLYFINGYCQVLGTVGRDKQRDGKTYRLEVNSGFPHGIFEFEYENDSVGVKFIADKAFKQYCKDDTITA